jgi:hypothetical protein
VSWCTNRPYPYAGANLLKFFTDTQVFLVALVGLILRIDKATMEKEQFGEQFVRPYSNMKFDMYEPNTDRQDWRATVR